MRERVLYYFLVTFNSSSRLIGFLIFLGVFWGGIRYTLHVFSVRGVIKYDENIVKIIQLGFDREFCLCLIRMMIL